MMLKMLNIFILMQRIC